MNDWHPSHQPVLLTFCQLVLCTTSSATSTGMVGNAMSSGSLSSKHYSATSPYRESTAGINVTQKSIDADVMLCVPGKRALMLECKWSPVGAYVGRDGYHQASSYLVEARAGIAADA
jgi:hypothetical protein